MTDLAYRVKIKRINTGYLERNGSDEQKKCKSIQAQIPFQDFNIQKLPLKTKRLGVNYKL